MEEKTRKILIGAGLSIAGLTLIIVGVKIYKHYKAAPPVGYGTGSLTTDVLRQQLNSMPIDTTNISDSVFPIKTGDRGKAVVLLQIAMNNKYGFTGDVDGRMGDQMRSEMYLLNMSPAGADLTVLEPLIFAPLGDRDVSIDKNNYNAIISGVDFASIFNANPAYKDTFNQYTA
jgi:hypothetical protein